MKEIWKKIEGFDNYSVSKDGEIRNTKTGRTLKKNNLIEGMSVSVYGKMEKEKDFKFTD